MPKPGLNDKNLKPCKESAKRVKHSEQNAEYGTSTFRALGIFSKSSTSCTRIPVKSQGKDGIFQRTLTVTAASWGAGANYSAHEAQLRKQLPINGQKDT